ncbi:hypothetical protein [Streptomyces hygroscopicus]|uniref:hypothetical protein n=1 Tax=Streptomyces hygroscopicus TaxID=1912 RepID=UPI000A9504B4|nr:hypothetical protein [Streptomyces hygroscopicus]
MQESIARLVEWLLRLVLPAPGRHRAIGPRPAVACADTPTVRMARVPVAHVWVPRGEDGAGTGLVRPYVVAHERQCGTAVHGVKAVAL